MSSLAVKYRPKTFSDVTEQSVVTDILESICENASNEMPCKNFLLTGPAGCGKAQPLSSHILTPNGYIEMGDVEIGTEVITENGDVAKVTGVYPQGFKDVYRICMNNGDLIDVSDEHLNVVYAYNEEHDAYYRYVVETKELKDKLDTDQLKLLNVPIPFVEFPHKDLEISPYLIGILFTDPVSPEIQQNYLKQNRILIRSSNFKLPTYLEKYNGEDFNLIDTYADDDYRMYTFNISNNYIARIKHVYDVDSIEELIYEFKTIPESIKLNDSETRYQFLEGALACGNAERDIANAIIISDCEIQDIYGFKFVCESLGNISNITPSHQEIYICTQHESSENIYDLFNTYYVYHLYDKFTRNISQIISIGQKECQCLMIDDESHTYISDNMIPTHNTTCARIMSNILNEGVGEPIEIDAASHGSADAVRELIQEAEKYPVGQRYKIFIVDECHSISNTSWQVFLRTLESAPARTIWIFCTTNPEKIPNTILSRVQTFQLSKISLQGINDRLLYVIDQENKEGRNITYEDEAVSHIAKLANGGMRDSLTLLDKALAYSNDLTMENITKSLNLPDYDDYFILLNAYVKKDNKEIIRMVDKVYNSGTNFVKWFEDFHAFVMNIVKYIFLKDINMTMIPSSYQDRIVNYTTNQAIVCLKLANVLIQMNQELKTTQYLQETALTYLCSISKTKEKQ